MEESSVNTGKTQKSFLTTHAFRQIVSQKRIRFQNGEFDLDLSYICPNVLAMGLPASGMDAMFRNKEGDVAAMLNKFHPSSYMIYNLAQKKYDYGLFENRVQDLGWKDHHAPGLELLFENVNSMCEFLKQDLKNVVVVHCKAGKGRTGTSIAAMLVYCGLYRTPEEALKYFSYRRANDISPKAGVTIPSQKRYIKYFSNILSGVQQPNRNKYKIISINVSGVPMYDKKNGTKLCVHVMQDTINEIYNGKREAIKLEPVVSTTDTFCSPDLRNTELDGDIMLKFCHMGFFNEEVKFRISFNTRMIVGDEIYWSFFKHDLDDAYKDDDVPSQFKLEIRMIKCGESLPPPAGVLTQWEKALRNRHLYQNLFSKMSYNASTIYDPANNIGDMINPSQIHNFLSQPQQVINGVVIENENSIGRLLASAPEDWDASQHDLFLQEQAKILNAPASPVHARASGHYTPFVANPITQFSHSTNLYSSSPHIPPPLPTRPKPSLQLWEQAFTQHMAVSQQPAFILSSMLQPTTFVQPTRLNYTGSYSSSSYNNNTPTNTGISMNTNPLFSPSHHTVPPQIHATSPSGVHMTYNPSFNFNSTPSPTHSNCHQQQQLQQPQSCNNKKTYDIPLSKNNSGGVPSASSITSGYSSFYGGSTSLYQQQYQQAQQFNTPAVRRPVMPPPTPQHSNGAHKPHGQ